MPSAAHHQEQTASFLRFASYKREQQLKEIDAAFEETVDTSCAFLLESRLCHFFFRNRDNRARPPSPDSRARLPARAPRLLGGDYTEDDVRNILDNLCSVLKADMGKELEHASHTHVLVLSQLFKQAEGMGLNFSVDTSELENHALLGEMKQFEQDAEERKAMEAKMALTGQRSGPALATLSKAADGTGGGHLDLVRKNNALEDEVAQWKQRFEMLKQQSLGMAQAHSALGSEREKLSSQFDAMSMEQQTAMMQVRA